MLACSQLTWEKPLRILFITPRYMPETLGGLETQVHVLTQLLASRHHVVLAAPTGDDARVIQEGKATIYREPLLGQKEGLERPRCRALFAHIIETEQIDTLVAYNLHMDVDETIPNALVSEAEALGIPVSIGVGGLLDFLSGRIPRAPVWIQEMGLEWAYRLMQEPRRMWRRYVIGNPLFLYRVWKERKKS